jgi:hypothetical protein
MVVLRGLRWMCSVVSVCGWPACRCVWVWLSTAVAGTRAGVSSAEGPVVLWLTVSSSVCMARPEKRLLVVTGLGS